MTREPKSYRAWLQRQERRLASVDDLNVPEFETALAVLRDSRTSSGRLPTHLILKMLNVVGVPWMFQGMLWGATCAYVRGLPAGLDRTQVLRRAAAFPKSSRLFDAMRDAIAGDTSSHQAAEFMADVLDKVFSRSSWAEDDLWWMYTERRGMDCEDVVTRKRRKHGGTVS